MLRWALILITSQLVYGCTVVVDGKRKQPPPSDVQPTDGIADDLDNGQANDDAVVDVGFSDLLTTPDAPPSDALELDLSNSDLGMQPTDAITGSDAGVGSPTDDTIGPGPVDAGGGSGEFILNTENDFMNPNGSTGTLTVEKEHAVVFPVDRSTPVKDLKQLSPTDLTIALAEFSCLGNANVQVFFPDTIQQGPGNTLKLLAGNPIGDALSAVDIVTFDSGKVSTIELELPIEVPQDNKVYEPGPLCYGVYSQGDWFFSFDPVDVLFDEVNGTATGTLSINFPAKSEALAVLTGQDIAISSIRYEVVAD